MSLTFAVDELYEAGWEAADESVCERAPDGRLYPTVDQVRGAFEGVGSPMRMQVDEGLGVFVASWENSASIPGGAVVAGSRDEAAVFALARVLGALAVPCGGAA